MLSCWHIIFWEVHPSFKIDLILVKKFETLAISSRHNWLKLPTFFLMGPKRLHQCPHITIYAILCMQHKTPKLYSKARWYEHFTLFKYGEMISYHRISVEWNKCYTSKTPAMGQKYYEIWRTYIITRHHIPEAIRWRINLVLRHINPFKLNYFSPLHWEIKSSVSYCNRLQKQTWKAHWTHDLHFFMSETRFVMAEAILFWWHSLQSTVSKGICENTDELHSESALHLESIQSQLKVGESMIWPLFQITSFLKTAWYPQELFLTE